MSTSFSGKFLTLVSILVDSLGVKGNPGNTSSKVSKSALSVNAILPGDVLFFKYNSEKWGQKDHVAMVVGNRRGVYGIFQHKGKRYLSAVKLNNIWGFTANLIIKTYRDKFVTYTPKTKEGEEVKDSRKAPSEVGDSERMKKAFMTLVGRDNYRTYIMNNMYNTYEIGDKED